MRKFRIQYSSDSKETMLFSLSSDGMEDLVGEGSPLGSGVSGSMEQWLYPKGIWPGFFQALLKNAGDNELYVEFTGDEEDYTRFANYARQITQDSHIDIRVESTEESKIRKLKSGLSGILNDLNKLEDAMKEKLAPKILELQSLLETDVQSYDFVTALNSFRETFTQAIIENNPFYQEYLELLKEKNTYNSTLEQISLIGNYLNVADQCIKNLNDLQERELLLPELSGYTTTMLEIPSFSLKDESKIAVTVKNGVLLQEKLNQKAKEDYENITFLIKNKFTSDLNEICNQLYMAFTDAFLALNNLNEITPEQYHIESESITSIEDFKNDSLSLVNAFAEEKIDVTYKIIVFELTKYWTSDSSGRSCIIADDLIEDFVTSLKKIFQSWIPAERGLEEKTAESLNQLAESIRNVLARNNDEVQVPMQWLRSEINNTDNTLKKCEREMDDIDNMNNMSYTLLQKIDNLLRDYGKS